MPTPEVSVIIPACAAESTLRRAVASALASRGPTVEAVIVADDDADYEAALDLPPEEAARAQFARTPAPRSGPSAARNPGMQIAQAPLLAFLDADDFYPADRLARLAPLARERGAATGPCVFVDENEAHMSDAPNKARDVCALSLETIVTAREFDWEQRLNS